MQQLANSLTRVILTTTVDNIGQWWRFVLEIGGTSRGAESAEGDRVWGGGVPP